eukprot:Skav206162  [mRNA]  locus=scaffold1545:228432:231576:- [translate_table: standard]
MVQNFHSPLIDALKPGAGKGKRSQAISSDSRSHSHPLCGGWRGRLSTFEACALFLREAEDCFLVPPGTWKEALKGSASCGGNRFLCSSVWGQLPSEFLFQTMYPGRKDFANHTVSIVIPWLAEKWAHMEGTMKAILHFTPDELVNEYIWISDGNQDSKEAELKALSPKVRVFAFDERQGLMRAKMKGVEMATAPVIVFLEAHVIPNKHWLQHILHRVVVNPKVLAMPVLDQIPQENWQQYYPMAPGHWRYEWNFNLVYTTLAPRENALSLFSCFFNAIKFFLGDVFSALQRFTMCQAAGVGCNSSISF